MRSKVLWEKDDLFKPYLKQTSRVVAYSAAQCGTLDDIEYARSQLGLTAWKRESSQLLIDIFGSTGISEEFQVVYNKDDRLVDWIGVMKSLKENCVKKRGRFRDDC